MYMALLTTGVVNQDLANRCLCVQASMAASHNNTCHRVKPVHIASMTYVMGLDQTSTPSIAEHVHSKLATMQQSHIEARLAAVWNQFKAAH